MQIWRFSSLFLKLVIFVVVQPSGSESAPPRRRSAYGLPIFLRHQDAMDEETGPKRAGSYVMFCFPCLFLSRFRDRCIRLPSVLAEHRVVLRERVRFMYLITNNDCSSRHNAMLNKDLASTEWLVTSLTFFLLSSFSKDSESVLMFKLFSHF